jgi:hypothetical protein
MIRTVQNQVTFAFEAAYPALIQIKEKLIQIAKKALISLKSLVESLGISSFVIFRSIGFFNSSLSLKLEVIWLRSSMAFCNFFSWNQNYDKSEKKALQQKVKSLKEGLHRSFDESCHIQIEALKKIETVEVLQRQKLDLEKENHLLIVKNKLLEGELTALKEFKPILETIEAETGSFLEKQIEIAKLYKVQLEKLVEQIELDKKAFGVSKEALEHFANLLGVAQRALQHFDGIAKFVILENYETKETASKEPDHSSLEDLVLRLQTTLGTV